MTLAEVQVKLSVILMDRLGPDIFSIKSKKNYYDYDCDYDSQEAEKENEINDGSRIMNLDSFITEMNNCKSCHEGKHISEVNRSSYKYS